MEKYIGNKKVILDEMNEFFCKKGITGGVILDAFAGTTNVGQYFKQRGYSVISNDVNEFTYVLGKAYLENNSFPQYGELLELFQREGFQVDLDQLKKSRGAAVKRITHDKIFPEDYLVRTDFERKMEPLLIVIQYLNRLSTECLNQWENLFFDYYAVEGCHSAYESARGTRGRRNYFTTENAKLLGKMMEQIKQWKAFGIINEMEFYILLASIIEEVTLNANVNGTFHDFNRSKLYPNAIAGFYLKPAILNIAVPGSQYKVLKSDANELYCDEEFIKLSNDIDVIYIDPPYNFRQYSAYYHLLNFVAIYHTLPDPLEYAEGFEFVRGQNMQDNFVSRYCYREKFKVAMSELVGGIKARHVVISYYDENNHWNHGHNEISDEGREAILDIFKENKEFTGYDKKPHVIKRKNYQSQSGRQKKQIDELLFYGRR